MSTQEIAYLDCAATTPLVSDVLAAMMPYLSECYGNASGSYSHGRRAKAGLEEARAAVAAALGCQAAEVVFTSGGSESDNLALRGVALAKRAAGTGRAAHLVTTAVEHEAVLATVHQLESLFDFGCTVVGVDSCGRVDVDALMSALRPETVLVSVMLANNEVGTLQPIAEIGARLRQRGVTFHTDAVQAAAWVDLDVERLNVDLMSLSAHKFYGPKGVGILYVRQGTPLDPVQTGGGQESGRRSGTSNVAGAVGLARALALAVAERDAAVAQVTAQRDRLIRGLGELPGVRLTGHPTDRLPNHASFCIEGVRADALLLGLDMRGICASSGSACSSGKMSPSHVLQAMGVPAELANGALRFSLGRYTEDWEVDRVLALLPGLIERMRAVNGRGWAGGE